MLARIKDPGPLSPRVHNCSREDVEWSGTRVYALLFHPKSIALTDTAMVIQLIGVKNHDGDSSCRNTIDLIYITPLGNKCFGLDYD